MPMTAKCSGTSISNDDLTKREFYTTEPAMEHHMNDLEIFKTNLTDRRLNSSPNFEQNIR